eukprot:TRINITY_DN2189_c0_g1_i1.p2 TRINITY_DN2189_c0_g1~~TRINITY_DN2189_c0_g1_i1.p2  ORF type:complete len:157 (-),score=59.96 TRINITY_DN2189_c0_g1_i1:72-542(-)
MREMTERGAFVEHTETRGTAYGTSLAEVQRVMDTHKICLLDVNVSGAQALKKLQGGSVDLPCLFVFIAPPSLQALEERLRHGADSDEAVRTRLADAKAELELTNVPGFVDHLIINDDLDRAYNELRAIVLPYVLQCEQYRLATARNTSTRTQTANA